MIAFYRHTTRSYSNLCCFYKNSFVLYPSCHYTVPDFGNSEIFVKCLPKVVFL